MEYRRSNPADHGFSSDDEQLAATRDQILHTMSQAGPNDMLDSVLMLANICEQRAMVYQQDKYLCRWYLLLGMLLRGPLQLTAWKDGPRPAEQLENPILYFPDVEHLQ